MNIFILSIKPLKCEFAHSSFSVILLNICFISLSLSPLSTYFAAREGKFTFFLLYYFFILILKKKKKTSCSFRILGTRVHELEKKLKTLEISGLWSHGMFALFLKYTRNLLSLLRITQDIHRL